MVMRVDLEQWAQRTFVPLSVVSRYNNVDDNSLASGNSVTRTGEVVLPVDVSCSAHMQNDVGAYRALHQMDRSTRGSY
jgi:hypothetical protein